MTSVNNLIRSSVILVLCLSSALSLKAQSEGQSATPQNHNFEVAKNLDIFNALYRDLDIYYVDTLDAAENINNAANYMLQMLDPYTEYYAEDDTEELQQLTTGKYTGIGCITSYRRDLHRSVIRQVFDGMPAAQAGVQAGDIILAVDRKQIDTCPANATEEEQTKYANQVSDLLRGTPGTTFELRVRRPVSNKVLTFKVTRRSIQRPSVTLATLVTDSVGYIKLSQFIEGTANEIRRSLVDLKQLGARQLVLDLRNNPGGVLEEAVRTVNLFVPRGREVVSTKGKVRELNHTYRTVTDAVDTDLPIVVLTNGASASAAEITSGALQDYDRALIMGQRTYGKGLVQQSRSLPYKTILKLTTAKYYIPSGRCVQAYKFKDGEPIHQPDSLTHEFRTAAGRVVRDGGGITPDVVLPTDSLPTLLAYLERSDQLFDFAVRYHNTHPKGIVAAREFRLTSEEYADFCKYLKDHNFTYDRQSLRLLQTLRQVARIEGYDEEARSEFAALEKKLEHNLSYDLKQWEPQIRHVVEGAIVEKYYNEAGHEEYDLMHDDTVRQAVGMLKTPQRMHKLLSGEPEA